MAKNHPQILGDDLGNLTQATQETSLLNEIATVSLIYARLESADKAERTLVPALAESTHRPTLLGMTQRSAASQEASV